MLETLYRSSYIKIMNRPFSNKLRTESGIAFAVTAPMAAFLFLLLLPH